MSNEQDHEAALQEAATIARRLGNSSGGLPEYWAALTDVGRAYIKRYPTKTAPLADGRPSFWPGDMAAFTSAGGGRCLVNVKKSETRWDKNKRPHLVYRVTERGKTAVFVAYAHELEPLSELDQRVLRRLVAA